MVIIHQAFLDFPNMQEFVKQDAFLDILFQELHTFVQGQLMPLKTEIDLEESEKPDKLIYTKIDLFNTIGEIIQFQGYSKNLNNKMAASFSKSDIDYISKRINNIRLTMDN